MPSAPTARQQQRADCSGEYLTPVLQKYRLNYAPPATQTGCWKCLCGAGHGAMGLMTVTISRRASRGFSSSLICTGQICAPCTTYAKISCYAGSKEMCAFNGERRYSIRNGKSISRRPGGNYAWAKNYEKDRRMKLIDLTSTQQDPTYADPRKDVSWGELGFRRGHYRHDTVRALPKLPRPAKNGLELVTGVEMSTAGAP